MNPFRDLFTFASAAFVAMTMAACAGGNSAKSEEVDHNLPDTLRVATLYSPSSFFYYRDEPMGYDYNLISSFAEDKGLELQIEVAPSLNRAMEMLDSGMVDIIAYEIPEIAEYKDAIVACGPRNETHQVLVQPKVKGKAEVNDVIDLPGHDVYVEPNSKYLYRLQNLNEEIGGGINIHIVENDTLIADDLIEMVANGELPMTVVDNDIAMVNATYYPKLDVRLALSFPQTSAWGVAPVNSWLGDSIDAWLNTDVTRQSNIALHKRYFEISKINEAKSGLILRNGRISQFDDIFRRFADDIHWDWRMLSAMCYEESRFNNDVESWAGAQGIMQIMPRTARAYGFDPAHLAEPSTSVAVSVKILGDLDRMFSKQIPNENERIKFMLAAYNAGVGHVKDAITIAAKQGLDPTVWSENVEKAMLMKSQPEYYNDPAVKNGYFRGRQTVAYVKNVMSMFDRFRREVPA